MSVAEILILVAKYWSVIEVVIDVLEKRRLSPEELTQAIEDAMTAANDAYIAKKYPVT